MAQVIPIATNVTLREAAMPLSLGPANVPVGVTKFEFSFDTTTWLNPARFLDCAVAYSPDAGSTWMPFVGITLKGTDDPVDRQGVHRVYIASGLGDETNPNRQLRATVNFSGPDWTTSVNLTLT